MVAREKWLNYHGKLLKFDVALGLKKNDRLLQWSLRRGNAGVKATQSAAH